MTSVVNVEGELMGHKREVRLEEKRGRVSGRPVQFVIGIGGTASNGVNLIGTRTGGAATEFINLKGDHFRVFERSSWKANEVWQNWFACAAIATYGFREHEYFNFEPNAEFLHVAGAFTIKIWQAFDIGLLDSEAWTPLRTHTVVRILSI